MSTELVIGGIYQHPALLGHRLFRLLAVTDAHVVIRPVTGRRRLLIQDTLNHFTSGCYELVDAGTPDQELLAVAEAVGVVVEVDEEPITYQLAGEQPAVEFSAGPVGPGPLWSDANLAREFFGGETA